MWAKLGISADDIIFDNPFWQSSTQKTRGCQIDYMIQCRNNTVYVCRDQVQQKLAAAHCDLGGRSQDPQHSQAAQLHFPTCPHPRQRRRRCSNGGALLRYHHRLQRVMELSSGSPACRSYVHPLPTLERGSIFLAEARASSVRGPGCDVRGGPESQSQTPAATR